MRKGQIDAMGLVIIVILLVVIGLAVMFFTLRSSSDEDNFLTIKANSLMNALDKADLNEGRFRELVGGCCEGVDSDCDVVRVFFDNLVENIDENASLYIDGNYFSGRDCDVFVSSTSFVEGVSCSASVRMCK